VIGHLGLGVEDFAALSSLSQTSLTPAHYLPNHTPNATMENGQPKNYSQSSELSLSRILDDETIEHLEHTPLDAPAEGWDEEVTGKQLEDGYCVECEGMPGSPGGSGAPELTCHFDDADQPAQVYCETCTDNFCDVCFAAQHRKGSRKQHKTKPLTVTKTSKAQPATASSNGAPANGHDDEVGLFTHVFRPPVRFISQMDVEDVDSDEELEQATQAKQTLKLEPQPVIGGNVGEWFVERSKHIPMRLTLGERKYLRLLEAALNVSEYVCRPVPAS
jgi:hypothetical protein